MVPKQVGLPSSLKQDYRFMSKLPENANILTRGRGKTTREVKPRLDRLLALWHEEGGQAVAEYALIQIGRADV